MITIKMRYESTIIYYGNKFKESKKNLKDDYSNFKIIAEPFGGSYGFSRAFYYPDTKYMINDADKSLIDAQLVLKNTDYQRLQEEFQKIYNELPEKDYYALKYIKNNRDKSGYHNLLYFVAGTHYLDVRKRLQKKINDFDKYPRIPQNVEFYNMDAFEFVEFVKSKELIQNILFYFDPPYLEHNSCIYINEKIKEHYDYSMAYVKVLEEMRKDVKCILVVAKLEIIKILFDGFFQCEYPKSYGSHKKTIHCVFSSLRNHQK